MGRQEDGLSAAVESVEVMLALVQRLPVAFQDDFVKSSQNLALRIKEAGQKEEEVPAYEQALQVAKELGLYL